MSTEVDSPAKTAIDLTVAQINRALSDNPTPSQRIHVLTKSFTAFEWSRSLVEQVGVRKLNLLLARLRHSTADRLLYRETVGCVRSPLIAHQNAIPLKFQQWENITGRFSLHRHGGSLGQPATFRTLASQGVENPAVLLRLTHDQIQCRSPPSLGGPVVLLWQASRSLGQSDGANTTQLQLMAETSRLVGAIRAGSVEGTPLAQARESCKRSL